MKLPENWKTTVAGVTAAFFAFVMFSPHWFHPVIIDIAKFATVGGLAALGLSAKDAGRGASVTTPEADHVMKTVEKAVEKGEISDGPKPNQDA